MIKGYLKKYVKYILALSFSFIFAVTSKGYVDLKTVSAMAQNETKGYIAIIIDDFGYDGEGTEEMLSLDIPITPAIMPFCEKSEETVQKVKSAGMEYIIHMPMESLTGRPEWVGKGIYTKMTKKEVLDRIDEALKIEPDAVGVNNHMGSAVMENENTLGYVLDYLEEKNMLFIDSVTSQKSAAKKICQKNGECLLRRDVFLDSTDDINKVKKQLKKAADIALKNGTCVAIGHVGPEGGKITAKAIKDMYSEIRQMQVEFVTISRLREILENEG